MTCKPVGRGSLLFIFQKQLQVDFKHRLEQAHVGSLVQANLVFPDVDQENLTSSEGKQGALSLEILVLSTFSAVGTLDIHNENVICHRGSGTCLALVLGQPDTLSRLTAFRLGHDRECGAEEVVQEGRLSRRLRSKHGDEVVVEACLGNVHGLEVVVEVAAMAARDFALASTLPRITTTGAFQHILELLLFIYDLTTMVIIAVRRLVTDGGKVAVHGCCYTGS